ncbi:hypothetical protein P5673_003288 [Acropora cervicornis]|uniref:Uncharacterized protein n=1 Tax=Acropora cervicornis TaxID=6130 RepID=A0AAD9VEW9_ACRCE|nr:hypothetical protein P5673_003288 [Acropora cervicornis]
MKDHTACSRCSKVFHDILFFFKENFLQMLQYLNFVLCKSKEELSKQWHNFAKKVEVAIFG